MRRVYYVLLATVLAFFVSTGTQPIAAEPSQTFNAPLDGRQLRSADIDSAGVKERGVDSLAKWPQVKDWAHPLGKWAKVKYWALVGKSEEYVKQSLGLDKLTGKALKTSPAYKYYEEYLRKTGGLQLIEWLHDGRNGVPTHEVWRALKLPEVPAARREGSKAFKIYVRYATTSYTSTLLAALSPWLSSEASTQLR